MITIVDYIGHSDVNWKPMGHPIKVTNEFIELLRDKQEIGVAVPKLHMPYINKNGIKTVTLSNNVGVFSTDRFKNFKKKIQNLNELEKIDSEIFWFINIDFSLFLYLYLSGKLRKKKIWITLCYNPLSKITGWRKKVITDILEKIELIIVTNQNLLTLPGNTFFIPDYYYKENLYSKYKRLDKEEQILCVGTMGETKKLEELVEAFNNSRYLVKIIGNFSQMENRFEKLKSMATSNITLVNKIVTDDEYYSLISKSKYIILPYNMELYEERTSGILLESIFLKSIPIAPKNLLDYNSINGIGYEELSEVVKILDKIGMVKSIEKSNDELIETIFNPDTIIANLLKQI